MNPFPLAVPAAELLARFFLESSLILILPALLQSRCRLPWKRALWQIAFLSLAPLLFIELNGGPFTLALWRRTLTESNSASQSARAYELHPAAISTPFPSSKPAPPSLARIPSDPMDSAAPQALASPLRNSATLSANRSSIAPPSSLDHTSSTAAQRTSTATISSLDHLEAHTSNRASIAVALSWLALAVFFFIRAAVSQISLQLWRRRHCLPAAAESQSLLAGIARQLNFTRRVTLLQSPRLRSPIAFGALRPTIVIPPDFNRRFSTAQQQVMLAHELAHLAHHDPLWHLYLDFLIALCWWQPALWFARREFQLHSETLADDASALIPDGPQTLAECLIDLGKQLHAANTTTPLAWISIDGARYHSRLAQRVQRLLSNPAPQLWIASVPGRFRFAKFAAVLALTVAALFSTAWIYPQPRAQGDVMNWKSQWKHSLAGVILVSALNNSPADSPQPLPPPSAGQPPGNSLGLENVPPATSTTLRGKSNIEEALKSIVIHEALYDNLPLSEVVRSLADEVPRLDPRHRRINFLIGKSRQIPSIDLNTVAIHLKPAVNAPHLVDLLDAITRTAEQPIHFTVTDYAVVFAEGPAPADPSVVLMRRYGIEPRSPAPTPSYPMDPMLAARYGLKVNPTAATPPSTPDRTASLQTKLNNIIFDEVLYDGIPLSEVVRDLSDQARKRSSDKTQLNFLFTAKTSPSATVDALGQPIPPGPPLTDVIIRLVPPLRHVTMRDVLDAVTQTADRPLHYEILPYGISFALDDAPPAASPVAAAALDVATFQVDPENFVESLQKTFGPNLLGQPQTSVQQALQKALETLGVRFDSPEKSVHYNQATGIILLRGTAQDLKTAAAAIETLGGARMSDAAGPGPRHPSVPANQQNAANSTTVPNPLADANSVLPSDARINILGEVKKPGSYTIPAGQHWTILDAIGAAGGFTQAARPTWIEIIRPGQRTTPCNFDQLRKNSAQAPAVQPGDLINVPAKFF